MILTLTPSDKANIAIAIGTIILAIVAIIALFKSNKPKRLTKIEEERLQMEKNKIEAENKKRLFDSRPRFRIEKQPHHGPTRVELILINDGALAEEITVEDGVLIGATWYVSDPTTRTAKNNEYVSLLITSSIEIENVSFTLAYKDVNDNSYSQRIFKEPGSNFKIERVTMD